MPKTTPDVGDGAALALGGGSAALHAVGGKDLHVPENPLRGDDAFGIAAADARFGAAGRRYERRTQGERKM